MHSGAQAKRSCQWLGPPPPPTTTPKEARTAPRRSYDDQRGDGWHLLPQEIWRRLREQSGPQEVPSAVREGRAAPAAGR